MSTGTYVGTNEKHVRSHYSEIKHDPVGSVVETLVRHLGEGSFENARHDYQNLLHVLRARGLQGKDVRYVQRELAELTANESAHYTQPELTKAEELRLYERIRRTARRFLEQLPSPSPERSRTSLKLEHMVSDGAPQN